MFGTSGVRGAFGEAITADLALDVGRALAVDGAERVVIGRDPRTTGPLLADAVSAGLRECGADVVELGLAATPTIARSVAWQDADAGVAITASHNPPADNGIKLWSPSGMAFDEARRERVAAIVEGSAGDAPADLGEAATAWSDVGETSSWDDATRRHADAIQAAVRDAATPSGSPGSRADDADPRTDDASDRRADDTDPRDGSDPLGADSADPLDSLEVVVDVGNGAGGVTAPALRGLGARVETLNAEPDGRFPSRPSEPTAEHLSSLCAHVAATDAALGVAHDGDADRTIAVDETGAFVGGDALLALFAREAVEAAAGAASDASGREETVGGAEAAADADAAGDGDASGGPRVAVPLNTSLAVEAAVEAAGGSIERTRVGDVFVAERAREDGVVFGGEPSGAWIWPDQTLAPDGPLAACRLAATVANSGPLSALVDDLEVDAFPIRRESHESGARRAAVDAVASLADDRYDAVSQLDGVRVETDDGWFLVRASGTQPLVRLTAQARSEAGAEDLLAEARQLLEDAREDVE